MLGFELDGWDYLTFATLALGGAGFVVTLLWIAGSRAALRWRASTRTPMR